MTICIYLLWHKRLKTCIFEKYSVCLDELDKKMRYNKQQYYTHSKRHIYHVLLFSTFKFHKTHFFLHLINVFRRISVIEHLLLLKPQIYIFRCIYVFIFCRTLICLFDSMQLYLWKIASAKFNFFSFFSLCRIIAVTTLCNDQVSSLL